ncbi:MAG: TetR/AcrR family transcriptional regulator [Pseudomonadota bacterium]
MTLKQKERKAGRPPSASVDGRELIKQAALEEFARNGFSGARIEQIAKAAGVAKPLVYYHFASKEELWTQSVSEACDLLRAQVEEFAARFADQDPENVIDAFSIGLVRFAAENPSLVRISMDETRQGTERAEWLKANYLVPTHKIATSIVNDVARRIGGKKKKRLAAHVVPTLFGAVNFPYISSEIVSEVHNVDVSSDVYVEEQARYISLLIRALIEDAS